MCNCFSKIIYKPSPYRLLRSGFSAGRDWILEESGGNAEEERRYGPKNPHGATTFPSVGRIVAVFFLVRKRPLDTAKGLPGTGSAVPTGQARRQPKMPNA